MCRFHQEGENIVWKSSNMYKCIYDSLSKQVALLICQNTLTSHIKDPIWKLISFLKFMKKHHSNKATILDRFILAKKKKSIKHANNVLTAKNKNKYFLQM